MGINHESSSGGIQADFLQLLAIDDATKNVKRLMIARDTLTLRGDQGEVFLRGGRNLSTGTKEERMALQEQHIAKLFGRYGMMHGRSLCA